jgi:hypothetical protein
MSIHPKEVEKDLVHKVARQYSIVLPGFWHQRVVDGTGDVCKYQERDTIRLFAADAESLEAVRNPHTARGSVAAIPKAVGRPKRLKSSRAPKVTHDWIRELIDRGENQETGTTKFAQQIQVDKMITLTTDGGALPNPGPAGWGVLARLEQSKGIET